MLSFEESEIFHYKAKRNAPNTASDRRSATVVLRFPDHLKTRIAFVLRWGDVNGSLGRWRPHGFAEAECASSALDLRLRMSGKAMKTAGSRRPDGEMRPEYDFSGGVRGKYAERFARGSAGRAFSSRM